MHDYAGVAFGEIKKLTLEKILSSPKVYIGNTLRTFRFKFPIDVTPSLYPSKKLSN